MLSFKSVARVHILSWLPSANAHSLGFRDLLNPFSPNFYTPSKRQNFLTFSGGKEMEHFAKMV